MRVGVIVGGIRVDGTAVNVGGRVVSVGERAVGVPTDKTSTEKMQAFSNSIVNTKLLINRNHRYHFIAFSLSAVDGTTQG